VEVPIMNAAIQQIHEQVRERYAKAALAAGSTGCVGTDCCGGDAAGDVRFGSELYSFDERDALPAAAVAASLGCGNPVAVADLHPGEVVLDLGSGGGIDVIGSARRVGPTGKAYGVDMTDEMLELARRNAAAAQLRAVAADPLGAPGIRPAPPGAGRPSPATRTGSRGRR
jgi:SAM-dependent methyltransferase